MYSILQDDGGCTGPMDPNRTDYECDLSCIKNSELYFENGACGFIRTQAACEPSSVFNYYSMYYCHLYDLGEVGRVIVVVIVGSLILFVFMYNLSTTADNYLAPTLEYLTIRFKINESLAGVTLLAFGNGAPDVFASISANLGGSEENPDPNNTLLSICSLVGATCFLSSVI